MSILSFPDRGVGGKNSWHGNCSPKVYQQLFQDLKPSVFNDPMMGSGTSIDVATQMGIDAHGLDLHQGFNAVTDSILDAVGKPSSLSLSHPPYGKMVRYSKDVWPKFGLGSGQIDPNDLSELEYDDFIEKMIQVLLNQRDSVESNGHYGTIIGDMRIAGTGEYLSFQADLIARMPPSELRSVMIKAQHNTRSGGVGRTRAGYAYITHEYILLWQKALTMYMALSESAKKASTILHGTWRNIVKNAMVQLGGEAELKNLYDVVSAGAGEKVANNPSWQAKIRQVLQKYPEDFANVQRGVWTVI